MILTVTMADCSPPPENAFSFGAVAIEVRPAYIAAYSVGGGEMDDLSSA